MNYPAASRQDIKSKNKYGIAASCGELNPLCGIKNLQSEICNLKLYTIKMILALVIALIFFPVVDKGYAGDLAFCTGIADGDTVFVKINNRDETVRLIGINTPEIDGKYVSEEFFGKEASKFTKKLVKREKVRLEYDIEKRDKYNRLLAYVYLPDGRLLNRILVKNGYAKAYKFFKYKMKKEFIRLEKAAKADCLGLWSRLCDK